MEIILKYFPDLTPLQLQRFEKLQSLYEEWNSQINVISRKDIHALYEHHVLHSLAIAKVLKFADGSKIIDVGTGGGFPGIPLAIMFENCEFLLIDSTAKKIKVVNGIIESLQLTNAKSNCVRSNELKMKFDFVVSRAVSAFPEFLQQTQNLIASKDKNALPNGILYLKGGNLKVEIGQYKKRIAIYEITKYFEEEYFKEKSVIYYS